jgi:hypothetical protein
MTPGAGRAYFFHLKNSSDTPPRRRGAVATRAATEEALFIYQDNKEGAANEFRSYMAHWLLQPGHDDRTVTFQTGVSLGFLQPIGESRP